MPRHFGVIVLTAGLYLAAVLSTAVASRSRVRWTGRLAAWVMHDLRIRVFSQLQRMSLDYFTDEKAGVIMTRMTSDIEALQQLLQDGLAQFAIQGLTMVTVTIVLVIYSVRLALITLLLVVPLLTVFSLWFRQASNRGYLRVRDALAGVLSDLSETLHGIRVVAAHNRQRHNVLHHRNVAGEYRDANNYTAQIASIYGPGTDMLGLLGQAAVLLIGGGMVLKHQLTVGELTAYVLYMNSLFLPVQQLVQIYNNYQQGQAAIVKLRGFLGAEPTVAEQPGAADAAIPEGTIEFRDVSFGYAEGKPVHRARQPAHRGRGHGGLRRAHRRGEVDDGQAGDPVLRPHQRTDPHRRPGPAGAAVRPAAPPAWRGAPGAVPVRRDAAGQHRLRAAGCQRGRTARGGPVGRS